MKKSEIDLSCFSNAKVWFLSGMSEKQAKNWIKRKFKIVVDELTEEQYSGITVAVSNLEWVVFVPSSESTSPIDLLKAIVHESAHVSQQLARNNNISDEETLCLITDFLAGQMSSILKLV